MNAILIMFVGESLFYCGEQMSDSQLDVPTRVNHPHELHLLLQKPQKFSPGILLWNETLRASCKSVFFFFSFSSNETGKIRNLPTCCSTAGWINLQLLPQNISPESNTNMLVERTWILTETDGEIHCVMLRNTWTLHHSLLMAPLLPVSSCVESVPQQQLD